MAEKVELKNNTVRLAEFNRRVDNSFKYFAEQEQPEDRDTVNELFRLYNKLFIQIPDIGNNSHQTLVERSSQVYTLPEDPVISLLQNEIADLRRQLLDANETINELSNINTDLVGTSSNG